MNEVLQYFRNIRDAVSTTLGGMKISLRYWLKEPAITVEYPDRMGKGITPADIVSDRYRGYLSFDPSRCIGCMQCMRTCAINCISISVDKKPEGRMITRFDVNQAKCMYCGLCAEECPAKALTMTKRFEGACYDLKDLRIRHVTEPLPVAKLQKEGIPA